MYWLAFVHVILCYNTKVYSISVCSRGLGLGFVSDRLTNASVSELRVSVLVSTRNSYALCTCLEVGLISLTSSMQMLSRS